MKCPTLSFVGISKPFLGGNKLKTVILKMTMIKEINIKVRILFRFNNPILSLYQLLEFHRSTILELFVQVDNNQRTVAYEY